MTDRRPKVRNLLRNSTSLWDITSTDSEDLIRAKVFDVNGQLIAAKGDSRTIFQNVQVEDGEYSKENPLGIIFKYNKHIIGKGKNPDYIFLDEIICEFEPDDGIDTSTEDTEEMEKEQSLSNGNQEKTRKDSKGKSNPGQNLGQSRNLSLSTTDPKKMTDLSSGKR